MKQKIIAGNSSEISLFVEAHQNKLLEGEAHDITKRKLAEQAQQELISHLSIGFGHNFRNILTGISGALEELSQTIEERGSIEIVP